jgi:bacillithiol biosynthesis cysteine-adding enzyme BshC
MNVKIERIPLGGGPLAQAYSANFSGVARFYEAGDPADIESYRQVAERIRAARDASDWRALAAAYDGDDPRIKERLEEVIRGRGAFVATGQQAGLFVSPLLTLYKALTAARLAAQLEEHLEIPVMPLFTIASEDHDWGEVDHTHIIDVENQLQRLAVDGPAGEAASPSVESVRLGDDVEEALAALVQATPNTEFKLPVLDPLRVAYRPGRRFASAFQDALAQLLARHRFLISRTAHPYVKERTRDVLWQEWTARGESERRLLSRSVELQEAGYEPQVGVNAGTTNLFLEGSMGRDRILHDGSDARLRRSEEAVSEKELQNIIDESTGRVSPGALLRPVTEARAFPVIAYVGGPAEIAYLAQSQVLFDLHEVPAPVVVPRNAFLLLEPKVSRVLEKYGLAPADLAGDASSTISRLLKEQTPPELKESIDALRATVAAALERVKEAAIEFDPGSKSAVDSGVRAVMGGIKELESRVQARVKEKNQVMQQQLEKAAVNLFPNGRSQERSLNPYPYLVRYGETLLDAVYDSVVTSLG